ncbi:MAG TPA: GSCFA domain-containing protein [Alphaproteobacteria bacterium]|nr:GSCFA domain-containing protein [Alphaproteobacteria bacterium]
MVNPYADLPDHQFWARAVALVEPFRVDPVVKAGFSISREDRVATAGSCFAQHISRSLNDAGFNHFVAEAPPRDVAPGIAKAENYGVFSCRYGNVYTVRQLLQLFEEAFGGRAPREKAWLRKDGRFVDPYRPRIAPDGHLSRDGVIESRRIHLDAVRTMFEKLDVFVFTLGLTEGWRSRIDGSVFPLAPGVAGGSYDPEQHEFVNFSVYDVQRDLLEFVRRLRQVNRDSRVVLTVSPVPLIATFEPSHVLVSNAYSKSVLRVAVEMVARELELVDYFPSYEIIAGHFNLGRYFADDLREVNSTGVSHAMRVFLRHYAGREAPEVSPDHGAPAAARPATLSRPTAGAGADIVCDEEEIDFLRRP